MSDPEETRQERATMEEIQEVAPLELPEPEPQTEEGLSNRQIAGLVLGIIVILAIVGLTGYGLVTHPIFTSVLRDVSIIVLALVTIIIGLFLIILIFQLQSLIALLRDEVKPILESANDTANTVRGTTVFVSDAVVTPVIQVASVASGILQTLRVLAGGGQKRRRRKRSQQGPSPE
jgi:hypothetical protein